MYRWKYSQQSFLWQTQRNWCFCLPFWFFILQNYVLIFKSFSGPKHLRNVTFPPQTVVWWLIFCANTARPGAQIHGQILFVSMKVFLDEINIWISGLWVKPWRGGPHPIQSAEGPNQTDLWARRNSSRQPLDSTCYSSLGLQPAGLSYKF